MNFLTPASVAAPTVISLPDLAEGEQWAGIVIPPAGEAPYHLILLSADAGTAMTWPKAKTWAQEVGGALPTRKEQALLFANVAAEFDRDWYWSGEQHAARESYAWYQNFSSGGQTSAQRQQQAPRACRPQIVH